MLVAALALLGAGVARADGPSVAVLGVEPVDVPDALASQLTDALRQRAAGTQGVKVVQGKDLIEIKMIFSCDLETPDCLAKAGKSLGADKLLYGQLKRANKKGHDVAVVLRVLDVHTAQIERSVSETVKKRELAAGNVSATAAKWFAQLVPVEARPTLTVTSEPSGSDVTVDGREVGKTPVTLRDLQPGTHSVVISAAGRQTQTRTVELRAGGASDLVVSLPVEEQPAVVVVPPTPKPPEPAVTTPPPNPIVTAPPPSSHPGRGAKIAALALLGAGVAAGAVAIYTWRSYNDLSGIASELNKPANPTQEQKDFFNHPTCTPPSSLGSGSDVQQYKSDCSRGQSFAAATTALWVVAGALAGASVISYIVGDRQARNAEKERKPSAARLFKQTLRVEPVFSTRSGGLQASFEF